jgi:hypothetical protein
MTGLQKMIRAWREAGWDDCKIWLHRKFCVHYFSGNRPDPCQWCGDRDDILYLVPGITPDGRMNWICSGCAVGKYGDRIAEEMEEFADRVVAMRVQGARGGTMP